MTNRPPIRIVITDLDNTLYDWVTFFAASFTEMIRVAAPIIGVDEDELLDDMRAVHQAHHNSEHPFALLEASCVKNRWPRSDRLDLKVELDDAFHAFNSMRKRTLHPYPGVVNGLKRLNELGIPIVGHTEATVPNAVFRLETLDLSKYLRKLYAIEPTGLGHPDPSASPLDSSLPIRLLSRAERKPDPRVVAEICAEFNLPPENALYIGDSISRDIGMALQAGATAVWASYGTRFSQASWDSLVRVTHWDATDVARATSARKRFAKAAPHAELATSFEELFDHFHFTAEPSDPDQGVA